MSDYIRLCPACGNENGADVMRCTCGTLLFGVDLVRRGAAAAPATKDAADAPSRETAQPAAALICPYDDCGQENPPGTTQCLYCNRPLAAGTPLPAGVGLLRLPNTLGERFRVVCTLPATGAEADILIVEPLAGGEARIVKLYRQGVRPRREVQERIERVPSRHRVEQFETGLADGYAYELMEYCVHGSLRERLGQQAGGRWPTEAFTPVVGELDAALAAVHAAGLVHRDLKPDNVLVRAKKPLQLVLTDFGTASALDATQRFTGTARTLPYASPESLSGVIDGKADYWALGMLLLEAALGRHPFAGLSEAVILHHLTTRSVDLGELTDARLRMLLRGLLLRDPKRRWGHAEVARWLAGDPTLAEPVEQGDAAGFVEPYHLGDERCRSPEQLAIALSRHWQAGVSDLSNGQLLRWFRDVQKDQNAVRLLLGMQHDQGLHVDLQLVRLMLYCAPGLPPVWRGESIELPAVLARASLALRGDADAAHWLDTLYRFRVLDLYAEAGNAQAAELTQRWMAAADRFAEAWQAQFDFIRRNGPQRTPGEVVLFDDVVFGGGGPQRPSLLALHPRLLAMAYDPQWSERLRGQLQAERVALAVHAPWLTNLGELETMPPPSLLAFEALLPEARQVAERARKHQLRQKEEHSDALRGLRSEAAARVPRLREAAQRPLYGQAARDELREALDAFFTLLARVRELGEADEDAAELRRIVVRNEPSALRIRALLDELVERGTANAGWFSPRTLGFTAAAALLLPIVVGNWALPVILIAAGAVAGWRLLPNQMLRRRIAALARHLR